LIDPTRWSDALRAADFDEVVALPHDGAPTDVLLHHVILARASGDEAASRAIERPSEAASVGDRSMSTSAAPLLTSAEVDARLAAAMSDERHDVFVDVVRHAVAHVLRIPDPTTLQRDQPLLDLGFDSLMAVELRNVLKESLSLERKLPATLAFDRPTIGAIARHLETLRGGTSPASDPSPPHRIAPATDGESSFAALSEAEVESALLEKLAELEG
jgi:acyl carrier protein